MSFIKTLGSIAGIVGAPFTGGTSLLPGLFGLGSDIATGLINRNAINKSTAAQLDAIQKAQSGITAGQADATSTLRGGQEQAYQAGLGATNQIQENLQPYQDVGRQALMGLGSAVGDAIPLKQTEFNFDPSQIVFDPSLKFTMDEAMKALSRSQAGKGALRSGATTAKALDLGTNLALQKGWLPAYQNAFNLATQRYQTGNEQNLQQFNAAQQNQKQKFDRLMSLGEVGAKATGEGNQALQSFGNNVMNLDSSTAARIASGQTDAAKEIAGLTTDAGAVQAGGAMASGRNLSGAISNAGYDVGNLISLSRARRRERIAY